ncbi:MAG: rod shape-determining protein MreC [Candidatus Marinimicrobia bacterium]|nr:rod shape-determining protein MreC [Candidatus Neomarinimicrobiota bacterium]
MIGYFYRYRQHWVLIVCVVLSLSIISSQNSNLSVWIQHRFSQTFSFVLLPYQWFTSNQELQEKIQQLEISNILLQNDNDRFQYLEEENERLRNVLYFQNDAQIELIPASILGISQSPIQSMMRIKLENRIGIDVGQAVISPFGIVGKIIRYSDPIADVQLINDPYFKISVKLEHSQIKGILENDQFCQFIVRNIPATVEVVKGELILTSGYSRLYPADIRVGIVTDYQFDKAKRFQTIYVQPTTDLLRLDDVFVLDRNRINGEK